MDARKHGFVTGGTWCLDRNITVTHWPEEDRATRVLDMRMSGGGSACNFACGMRRLDSATPVETMGLVGDDAEGTFLLGVADAHGIGRERLRRTDAAPTQATDCFQSAASGRRTHVIFDGTAALLGPEHFDFDGVTGRYFHLGLPGIHDRMDAPFGTDANGWVTVLRRARAAGFDTNLELVTAPEQRIRDLVLPCLPHLTTLVVNDFEIGALSGRACVAGTTTDVAACQAAAGDVLARGAMELVAVHFITGAVLCSRDGSSLFVPSVAVPDAEVRGANGAGDAFAAGFFHARSRGQPAEACLRMGHAAAAACLTSPGTYDGVAAAADCLALADRYGWRM